MTISLTHWNKEQDIESPLRWSHFRSVPQFTTRLLVEVVDRSISVHKDVATFALNSKGAVLWLPEVTKSLEQPRRK